MLNERRFFESYICVYDSIWLVRVCLRNISVCSWAEFLLWCYVLLFRVCLLSWASM